MCFFSCSLQLCDGIRLKDQKGFKIMELLLITILFLLFDAAALLWGVDSRDGVNSPEWERRHAWRGFN